MYNTENMEQNLWDLVKAMVEGKLITAIIRKKKM